MKEKLMIALLAIVFPVSMWSADGDVFTAQTPEGITMTFKVLSEKEKTAQVGTGIIADNPNDDDYVRAIGKTDEVTGKVTIPKEAAGYTITAIGDYAFDNCKLSEIVIPESILTIGNRAFFACRNIEEFNLPNSLRSIGDCAFWNCNMEKIEIPASVEEIGEAFAFCEKLTSVSIGAGVKKIGIEPFLESPNVTSMIVDENNSVYDSRENCNAIIETASNTLIQGFRSTIIPNTVDSIGPYAFSQQGLTEINLPEGVECIERGAFGNKNDLKSVRLPESLRIIEKYAFISNPNLTEVILPQGLIKIGENAFNQCPSLIRIISNVTVPFEISEYVFGNESFMAVNVYQQATLYVPDGTINAYKSTSSWNKFTNIVEMGETGIPMAKDNPTSPIIYYNVGGQQINEAQKGINIIRYNDGTVRKVVKK